MGKGKSKRKAKRKIEAKQRREIRLKMGKPVFFNLTNCPKPLSGFSDRYNYKSNIHKAIYKKGNFHNVRWQASILTHCNFNQTHLIGVDFFNSNLKKTSFKNAVLENVIFFNCNLKDTNFENAQFRQVIFIATNLDLAKNLTITEECKVYRSYPSIELDHAVHQQLLSLSEFELLYKYNVLHVNKNKLNLWSIQVLLDCYGENVFRALCALKYKKDKRRLYTVYSYMRHIEKYLKL